MLGGLVPRVGSRDSRVFGYRMTLDLSDLLQRMIYLGIYEREETEIALRRLKPGMTFLDVGANVGYFTLLASSRVGPKGRVIAVEPSGYAYRRLTEVVARNGLVVATHRLGLSDRDGVIPLYLPADETHNHSPTMVRHEGAAVAEEVPVRRLDDCLKEWDCGVIDLLKIDVEGHEAKVFAGARDALASGQVRSILCEFNDYWLRQSGSSPQALHDMLTGLGFVDRDGVPEFVDHGIVNRFLEFGAPSADNTRPS